MAAGPLVIDALSGLGLAAGRGLGGRWGLRGAAPSGLCGGRRRRERRRRKVGQGVQGRRRGEVEQRGRRGGWKGEGEREGGRRGANQR